MVVTRVKERILNPDRVRNIFLGVNDGMVEILGAVSGFFASFGHNSLVLVAGLTTAVAGAISMAAGAYVAIGSEQEVRKTQEEKARFLGETHGSAQHRESILRTGVIVGISYFIGSSFPLIPVIFGAKTALPSVICGGSMILLVSVTLAFLSGMDIRKRTGTNLVLIALVLALAAVASTGYFGFLVGPPLIGFVAEITNLSVGLGLVSVCCALIAVSACTVLRPPSNSSLTSNLQAAQC